MDYDCYTSIDNDVDGWNSNVDCNDNNSAINPGASEILGNGKDDDCNPITLDNYPPVVSNQTIRNAESIPINITLTASDADSSNLTYFIVSHTTNGNLTGNPPLVTYEPTQGFIGTDSFTFIANDGVSNSSNIGFIKIITGDQTPVAENKTVRMLNINPVTIYLPAEES